MRCIYCLEDSTESKSVAHVIPEAIAKNEMVLPRGTVCDACNHYLGHELDSVLVAHPVLSLIVQFLQLPGKQGAIRKQVGNVSSITHAGGVTIPCAEPTFSYEADGTRVLHATPLVDRSFDLLRFRRAIYHVAFNALIYQDGVERAYEPVYNDVRRYVRQPRRREAWPFVQYINLNRRLSRDVTLLVLRGPATEFGGLVIGRAAAFAADLRNSGSLEQLRQNEFPSEAIIVAPSHDVPRTDKQRGPKRYRVTIMLDE